MPTVDSPNSQTRFCHHLLHARDWQNRDFPRWGELGMFLCGAFEVVSTSL